MYSCTHLPAVSWAGLGSLGAQRGPPVCPPHRLAEQWFCPLEMFLCAAGTERLCLLSPAPSGRCEGGGTSSSICGLKLLTSAGWTKAGCSPEDRACLVSSPVGSGVMMGFFHSACSASLRNLYILLSFPYLLLLCTDVASYSHFPIPWLFLGLQ